MTTINKYRIRCTTDNTFEYVWSELEPTKCPTNTSHTIDTSKTSIIDTKTNDAILVREESVPTGGHFKTETIVMNINASSTFQQGYTWNFPISILAVYLVTTSDHEGDNLEISVSPNTIIGGITSNVDINDIIITVSDTVIQNTSIGYKIILDDGTNSNDLGYVTNVDIDNKQLTITTPATHSFDTSNTAVKRTVLFAENYEFGPAWEYVIGESKIGASYLPTGASINVKYINNTANAKKLVARLEYLY